MLSECINDFFKKYKKYIFIICIIFAILILWKLSNAQENINDTTSDTNSDNKKETTLGGFILYSFLVLVCGCLIPLIIMYYITKASARAAIRTTPCQTLVNSPIQM
jgi:hypothetical protein